MLCVESPLIGRRNELGIQKLSKRHTGEEEKRHPITTQRKVNEPIHFVLNKLLTSKDTVYLFFDLTMRHKHR